VVVACVAAWEALVAESVEVMRPAAAGVVAVAQGVGTGRDQAVQHADPENVSLLFAHALGVPDVTRAWAWGGHTSAVAVQNLTNAMKLRNQIAHGVNPRPAVLHQYSSQLPDFFRRFGRATDSAVRGHLVTSLGLANPWPYRGSASSRSGWRRLPPPM
jgi:hypothetical protein